MVERVTYAGLTKEEIGYITSFFHIFSNANRYSILLYLCKDDYSLWNEIIFDLELNPKTLRDHSKILKSKGMVEHYRGRGFKTTNLGKRSVDIFEKTMEQLFRRLVKMGFDFPLLTPEEKEYIYEKLS